MKKLIAMVMAGLSAVALADAPMVSNVKAQQRYPWNGLVDITCDVTGIDGTTNGLYFAVSAVDMDSGSTNRLSQLSLVQGETSSIGLDVHTNGNYRILWDAYADLGEVVYSNIVLSVTIKTHGKVQLWEDGPYWAETNIGAENAWDSGYYFWWGDTVGYKRENNAWVASDGSAVSIQFFSNDPISKQTYNKSVDTLQSEGWITSQGVLAPEHDAAHVHLGGSWRMPTEDELSALSNNCDWTWTTANGVNGCIVRGRGNYASASIFLPASGAALKSSLNNASSAGYGWSSVPSSNAGNAWGLGFSSNGHGSYDSFYCRYYGFSVRPVQGFTGTQTTPHAADSAPFFLDTRTGVRESDGTELLAYSSLWDGDAGATVTIAQDGVAIAEGLTGEDTYDWSVTRNGTYVLTHTTYTNGAAGKVEAATFVVTGKDVPFAPGDVTASGYSGKYDGVAHGITVQSDIEGFAVKYCNSQNGTYTTVAPTQTDVGSMTVWYEVSAPGYITTTNSATATITKRSVTLTSGSAGKVYDGTALVKHEVTVSGDGFVSGEGATYNYTGSQTGVGSSANSFAYTLNAGTKVGNYTITTANGTLTITKATNEWITEPSIANWTYGQAASVPNMGAVKFGTVAISYSATPQNAGTYTATFTVAGTANYTGLSKPIEFVIAKATYNMIGASWGTSSFTYDGNPHTVTLSGLPSGVTVASYSGNTATDAGNYTAHAALSYDTVNYNAPSIADKSWSIARKSIAGATITLGDALTYTGAEQTQSVTGVKVDGLNATYAVSGNTVTGAGTYMLTVSGTGNFTGSETAQFSIVPKALTDAMVTVADVDYVYDGTAKEPTVTVADGTPSILVASDYDVAYSGNVNAGEATVTVTGKGNYTGTVTKRFDIAKAEVTPPASIASKAYTGELLKADVAATARYTVANDGGVNVGSYPVTLTLTDAANYSWTGGDSNPLNWTFAITKATNEWIVEPSISDWIYGQAASVPNMGLAKFGSASVTYSAPPQGVGTYTATFTVPETANYMVLTKEVTFKITSAEAEKLKEVFDGRPATVESDGVGGWKVTITNDIDSADLPIELPDNLGHVTIDLNGHDLVGADGAAGDSSTLGGGGRPAIRIVLGTGDGDTTRISLTTTGGDSLVKGGDGGAGNPGGNGAPAVEVADGARSGVKIDIGAGVTLQGGSGGAAVGDGASPGEDSPAMVGGEIGTNSGTLVKVKVPVPVIPDAEYTGSEVSPTVPASPLYAAAPSSGTQPGAYPVILTLSDAVCYEWLPRAGAAVSGAIATTTYTILEPPPTIVIDDGGQSGAANSASYVGVYDGEAHGVEVRVSNPATGWTVRYAASREGPYTSERPLYTDVVLGAETWYEVSAAGFDPVTNVAVVTITPRSLASAMLGSLRFDDAGGVRRPVPMLVDDLGHEVPPANYDFAWTEEKSGAMTLSFAGRGNYLGVFETRLAQTRFRVSFDANGGTVDTDGADYDIGTYYGLLPVPVRAGFLFDGWYEKADFSGSPVTRNTEVIAQDLTLHAKWLRRALWYTDATFHLESAATYDGYLIDPVADDAVAGTISVKAGKPGGNGLSKLTVTVLVAGEKKATLKSTTYDGRLTETVDGRALDLALGFSSMSGTLGRFEIDGSRNLFAAKDADSKLRAAQALKQWQGTYVVAWQDPGATANGWNGLSLVVGSKGKVTANGTLADGTKVSAKSQLLVGERECAAAVSWTKKGASVACLAWFCEDGSVECGNLLGGAAAKIANSRTGAYLGADAAFHVDADALAAAVPGLMGDLVPDGLSVRMKGSAFDIDKPGTVKLLKDKSGIDPAALGTNPSGLKLKYKMKDATFSGTFAAYSLDGGKLKKTTVQVAGVVLGGVGYGTASVKKSGSVAVTIK